MRRVVRLVLILLFVVFAVVTACSQERSLIAVRSSELNNGVVIINIVTGGKSFQLQCNDGMSHCATLKSGVYLMVQLPRNVGMYDCNNVEIYPQSSSAEPEMKLGAYCLLEERPAMGNLERGKQQESSESGV